MLGDWDLISLSEAVLQFKRRDEGRVKTRLDTVSNRVRGLAEGVPFLCGIFNLSEELSDYRAHSMPAGGEHRCLSRTDAAA